MHKQIVIVSPALADANNGNWQTARRWQGLLRSHYRVRIVQHWPDGPAAQHDVGMLALHARRSAPSIAAWARQQADVQALAGQTSARVPAPGLAVVLTGTDLYRDILSDIDAQRSLRLARALVVLQELAPMALPADVRDRATVIFQSTSSRQPVQKTTRHLRAVMVGHLREEKSPQTLFRAAALLHPDEGVVIDHIGAALEPAWGVQAQAVAAVHPHYRWLGNRAHEDTRRRIQQAHVLVHTSRLEGGAHVLMEAVRAGTPVLASRMDGNVGMLGADYAGYFPWDDARALVDLLRRCRQHPQDVLYQRLLTQTAARAPLFDPVHEQQALLRLLATLTCAEPGTATVASTSTATIPSR